MPYGITVLHNQETGYSLIKYEYIFSMEVWCIVSLDNETFYTR